MATVSTRKGKKNITFQVRYRINGKQRTESFSPINKTKTAIDAAEKRAYKFAEKIEAEKKLGLAKNESDEKFIDYADKFMKIHSVNLKTTSKRFYQEHIKQLESYIGDKKLKDITPTILDDMFVDLKNQNKSDTLILRRRNTLNLILKSALKKDLISSNPLDKIDYKFTNNVKDKNKLIKDEDLRLLLNEASRIPKHKHFILLAFYTGMRRGEILALKWKHINLPKREIYVTEALNPYGEITTPKSKYSKRIIYIHEALYETLHEIRYYQSEMQRLFGKKYNYNDLVVCHDDGSYISTQGITVFLQRESDRLGIKISPHMLRHTFATKMRGNEMKDLQAILGHSSPEITFNTYQHFDEFKEETKDNLNRIFKPL